MLNNIRGGHFGADDGLDAHRPWCSVCGDDSRHDRADQSGMGMFGGDVRGEEGMKRLAAVWREWGDCIAVLVVLLTMVWVLPTYAQLPTPSPAPTPTTTITHCVGTDLSKV